MAVRRASGPARPGDVDAPRRHLPAHGRRRRGRHASCSRTRSCSATSSWCPTPCSSRSWRSWSTTVPARQGYVVGALDTRTFEARCRGRVVPGGPRAARRPGRRGQRPRRAVPGCAARPARWPPTTWWRATRRTSTSTCCRRSSPAAGARRLMDTLFDALRAGGSPGVHLGVAEANQRAIGFYEHLGMPRAPRRRLHPHASAGALRGARSGSSSRAPGSAGTSTAIASSA